MWTKLTHLVKRNSGIEQDNSEVQDQRNDQDASSASATANVSVMSRVYEQHPNLSHFHSGSAIHLASPSPPVSPSKGSRRSMFKRSLKSKFTSTPVAQDSQENVSSPASSVWTSPSPVKQVTKKVRASLQVDTFTAQSSKAEPPSKSAPLPSQPHTPITTEQLNDGAFNPQFEVQPSGTGSIRSILRDRNTPGTGQSVRFFSRDAYRVISPNVSEIDQDSIPDSEPFLEKLRLISPERSGPQAGGASSENHALPTNAPDNVVDMFSPPRPDSSTKSRKPLPFQPRHPPRTRNSSIGSSRSSHSRSDSGSFSGSNSQSLSSLTIPMPPVDMPNLFDVSQEHELVDIPLSVEGSLCDDAIEEVEDENGLEDKGTKANAIGDASLKTIRRSSQYVSSPASTSTPNHGRSVTPPRNILTPDGTVFHSMKHSSPVEGATLFHSFSNTTNERASTTAFFTPEASQSKAANDTAPSAADGADSGSFVSGAKELVLAPMQKMTTSSSDSSEGLVIHSQEELVASLRQQLSLQQQLASQFEVDLAARDELVSMLSTQLQNAELGAEKYRKEVERRQTAMRALRRKVSELEKICRGLEEEVDRSREESFERSVMDEASEGALVVLHGSIGQLKGELERVKEDEVKMREERDALKSEAEKYGEEKQSLETRGRELAALVESKLDEIRGLEAKITELSDADSQAQHTVDSLREEVAEKQQVVDDEREKHGLAESQWHEEKASLMTRLEAARTSSQDTHNAELEALRRKLDEREEEVNVLKAEVEAQWDHAEKADEKIKRLEGEKEGLAKSVQALHSKVEELGGQWKESDGRRAELEEELNDALAAKDEIEQERDQLVEDVNFEREHAEQLTQTLQEHDLKIDELDQERGYAMENVSRLEELLRRRDAEIEEAQSRIVDREQEAEHLRAQMSKMTREYGRSAEEKSRHLNEIAQREKAARTDMEDAVRRKAEDEVALGSIKGRVATLTDEVDRLRRQVHDLQQESADKEVKLLQLTKARAQDEEDKEGLNIALDSKQQELELLKRKLGVKGTGGSTPAPNRVGLSDLGSRRQSLAFATPSAPRPRPGSAIGITKPGTTETPIKKSLSSGIGIRATGASTVKPSSRMGPPAALRGTPLSASTSSLTRPTSSSKARSALPVSHRRSSSVMSSNANHVAESDKENESPAKAPARRASMVSA